jgi:aspartate-semialdehyde dehydrogenase
VPLVVPEVNGDRATAHQGIVANPNCSTIQLVCVLEPLHEAAGLRSVRVATYQSASGAGAESMHRLEAQQPTDGNVVGDWELEGDEFEEESKLRAESRKILELPELAFSASCARVPVLVGHSQAIWVETENPCPRPTHARSCQQRRRCRCRTSPRRETRWVGTRSSSGGSGKTPPAPGSRSSRSATTCARARR